MYGTEFARISGSYNTHFIGTYELLGQSAELSQSYFRLRGYFHYNASTGSVGSSGVYDGFRLDGVQLKDGNYRFYPGYTLLGQIDITVQHSEDGTFPGRSVGISAYSYHMSGSTSGNIYAPKINRLATITKANDFNDEENPYMEFTNPAGFKVNLRLEFASTYISRNGLTGSGGYTFELTDEERALLRQKCTANTLTVRYVVATLVDGTNESLWSYVDKTMTLINANPIFNDFTFEDINSTTVALTGNNQNIIKGYSNVQVTIPVESKAIAKKEAVMNKYIFTCGDKNNKEPMLYSETEPVIGTIDAVPNGVFKVFATDNRNKSTPVEKLANEVIEYSPLSKGSVDIYRNNGVSEEVKLVFDGAISNVNFGAKENSIVSALFRYKSTESGSKWSDPEKLEINMADGRFSFEGFVTGDLESKGFNISNSYEIEVVVSDELSNVVYTDTFGSGIPNLAYHKNGISVMGKYDVEEGGLFQIEGKRIDYNLITDGDPVKCGYRVDDKDVYVKRISLGQLPNQEAKYVPHGLNIEEIRVINFEGVCEIDYKTVYLNYNDVSTDGGWIIRTNIDGENIIINTSQDRSKYSAYINIYFTYRD